MRNKTIKTIEDYLKLPYRMEIIPDAEEGGFVISFPDLPGCLTSGETLQSAMENAEDAKKSWLEAAIEEGIAIHEPDDHPACAYSEPFHLQLPRSLRQSLELHSRQEGISINQYCLYLLAKSDAQMAAV